MGRVIVLGALVAVAGLSLVASGFQGAGRPESKTVALQKIKDNLYLVTGGGGNTAVFITDLGVVVVDTKLAGWGQPLLDKIKTITSRPIATIINTHAHGDHTGSNEFFGTAVEIIAQENTRANMDKMDAFKEEKVNYLPKLMFKDKMSIGAGKDKIDLYYFGAGHTNGDAWVVFPSARVVHAGDMFASKQPPIVDISNGGSGLRYPDSLAKAAAGIRNVDTIITGHSTLMPWTDLETYAEFTKQFRDVVVNGFNHGLSVNEITEAWMLPAGYNGYTAPPERVKADVEAIVGELSR
jgi:cyclase